MIYIIYYEESQPNLLSYSNTEWNFLSVYKFVFTTVKNIVKN